MDTQNKAPAPGTVAPIAPVPSTETKRADDAGQTRVARPDPASLPAEGQASKIGGDDPEPTQSMGVSDQNVAVSSAKPINLSGPYVAQGVYVLDSGGREIALIPNTAATLEARHDTAKWIADALNA